MSLVGFSARNHPQQKTNPRVDDRETDPTMFADLNARFRFSVDVAATPTNAKCERFYSIEDDGLAHSWAGERVWCNPPYSNIRPWIEKAWSEQKQDASLIVMLLPANRTEQAWWQDLVEPHRDRDRYRAGHRGFHRDRLMLRTEFIRGRTRFIAPGADGIGPNERPPFGCVLLIWSKA